MKRPLPLLLALALLGAACRPAAAPRPVDGTAVAGAARRGGSVDAEAVEAGYRERLRLGLGSPFRLAEQALVDERVDATVRRRIGAALLAQLLRGGAYEVDPAALAPVLLAPSPADLLWGRRHLSLVTETVRRAGDPRAGELTVRLAYQLAVLERSVDARTAGAAVQAASLVRDRELAVRDAKRLQRAAGRQGVAAVDLLPRWRGDRLLEVEAPALQGLSASVELQAIEAVPYLTRAIRVAALGAPERVESPQPDGPGHAALLRLAGHHAETDPVPHASVVAALRQTDGQLPSPPAVGQLAAWTEFRAAARSEEAFAARYRDGVARDPALRPLLATAALRAAVGLRTYAQERPPAPGGGATTAEDLVANHGVQVRVAEGVPAHWAAPTLRALDGSLATLRQLIPSLNLYGLRIEVTPESSIERALASHSPASRVLEWPVATGPGTLAHEIAHDLDWQAARRAGSKGFGYASSRAVAGGRSSFAAALATLTPAGPTSDHGTRPAEVLARNFEWFVLTRLAAAGRWDGVLSSAQDEVLTGHGSLREPGMTEAYGPAVIEALRPLIAIPAAQREGFLGAYGPARWPKASVILRATVARLETPEPRRHRWAGAAAPRERLEAAHRVRDEALGELSTLACRGSISLVDPALAEGYRALIVQAALAHGRAAALAAAYDLAGEAGRRWMLRELYGPLWPGEDLEPSLRILLDELVARLAALEEPDGEIFPGGIAAPVSGCGAVARWSPLRAADVASATR